MVDLRAQLAEIGDELERAVQAVVRGTAYIMGPEVARLEEAVAAALGVPHAIGVSSGTDALLVALMALDVGQGDLVLTTTYSFFATAGVVSRLGARPVFLDVDAATCNLDPAALEAWLAEHPDERARVKAIVPVHLFGQCADMGRIGRAAAAHGIPIVEDAAQAIGATWPGGDGDGATPRRAGTIGAIGCFSFHPAKNLGAIGDAGMVVTADAALAARLRRLRQHGAEPKYFHAEIGGNFRLDTIQAAALLVKLPRLERWSAARRARAARYDEALAPVTGVEPLACAWGRAHHIYNQYVVRVSRGARDALRAHLESRGVATQVFYPVPFHLQACFRHLGVGAGALPRAEAAAAETLALPIYPELTDAQQDHVVAAIRAHA